MKIKTLRITIKQIQLYGDVSLVFYGILQEHMVACVNFHNYVLVCCERVHASLHCRGIR